jgi:hypothetical protein
MAATGAGDQTMADGIEAEIEVFRKEREGPCPAAGLGVLASGFRSFGHLRIEFFLLQGFRAIAGQIDGEVGDPRLRRASRGGGHRRGSSAGPFRDVGAHEVRPDAAPDRALDGPEDPGPVRIDVRPMEDRGVARHGLRENAECLLRPQRWVAADVDRRSASAGAGAAASWLFRLERRQPP